MKKGEQGRKGKIEEDAYLENTEQPRIQAIPMRKYPSINSTCPDMVICTETFPSSGVDLEERRPRRVEGTVSTVGVNETTSVAFLLRKGRKFDDG